jgi:uncharacterized protein YfaP (DUF2135 family)
MISVAALWPVSLLAQSDSAAQMSQPATTAQAAPVATANGQATAAQPAAPVTQASSQSDLDRIECRSQPPMTGTRLGATRECHTVRAWNERMHENQEYLREQQGNMGLNGSTSSGGH